MPQIEPFDSSYLSKNLFLGIIEEFELGVYAGYELLEGGNAKAFKLQTSQGWYFLKPIADSLWLALYKTVEEDLNAAGVRQARLFSRPNGDFISSSGYAVFEFLPGEGLVGINDRQLRSLILYLKRYNRALSGISVPEGLTDANNPWTKADSLDYLFAQFPEDMAGVEWNETIVTSAERALGLLERSRNDLDGMSRQLIHGDVGPGNVLYIGDEVVSVVDFTPSVGSEFYSLCHFFYWQFLCFNGGKLDYERIRAALLSYIDGGQSEAFDPGLFYILFVKAAAFRLFGAMLLFLEYPGSFSEEKLVSRAGLLRLVMEDEIVQSPGWLK